MKPADMNALQTLLLLQASGRTVSAKGDALMVSRGSSMCEELKQAVRWNRDEILRLVRG